jgi:hypothetical protein
MSPTRFRIHRVAVAVEVGEGVEHEVLLLEGDHRAAAVHHDRLEVGDADGDQAAGALHLHRALAVHELEGLAGVQRVAVVVEVAVAGDPAARLRAVVPVVVGDEQGGVGRVEVHPVRAGVGDPVGGAGVGPDDHLAGGHGHAVLVQVDHAQDHVVPAGPEDGGDAAVALVADVVDEGDEGGRVVGEAPTLSRREVVAVVVQVHGAADLPVRGAGRAAVEEVLGVLRREWRDGDERRGDGEEVTHGRVAGGGIQG